MKIGLVCPYTMFGSGGVQEVVLALYEHLAARGHTVKIITPKPREYKGKIPTNYILLGTSSYVKSPFNTTAHVSTTIDNDEIDSIFKEEEFDVLHFHEPWVPFLSRQLLTRSTAVNVATFHAKLPETVMLRTIERVITPYTKSVLKYIHAFTAVSDTAAEYLKSLSSEIVHIIPNGIEMANYNNVEAKVYKKPTILFVGRLEKRKGVMYLLKTFQQLRLRNDARLLIGGSGPDEDKLKNYVEENNISDVSFLGYVSNERKAKLIKSADVFCSFAPYGESFGIVLLEAMAAGTPVVAASNPGYSNVLTNTGAISLVNPKDFDDSARRIEILLKNTEIRILWKKWAKKTILQYDYKNVADKYEDLYKSYTS